MACDGTDDTKGDPDPTPDDGDADADADTDADTDTDADSDTDVEPSTAETGDTETEPRTDLIGRTYALDVAGANWVEPANVGSLFATLLGDVEILAMPVAVDGAQIDWLFAPSASAVQAQCVPTVAAPTTLWADPDFEVGPVDVVLDSSTGLGFDELAITGTFAADLSRLVDVTIRGSIDTRPWVDLIEEEGVEDTVCILVGALGIACVPCPDGANLCLPIGMNQVDAYYIAGVAVLERTESDIANDPTCE